MTAVVYEFIENATFDILLDFILLAWSEIFQGPPQQGTEHWVPTQKLEEEVMLASEEDKE